MNQNNRIAIKVFENIKENGNVFFSPYSIYVALSMLMEGASDEAKQEAAKAVGFDFGNDMVSVNSINGAIWEVANSLWYDVGRTIIPDYKDKLVKDYNAEMVQMDFGNPQTVEAINSWVSKKTHEKIEKIIDSFNAMEVAVLINAVYFKGKWMSQFKEDNTENKTFHCSGGKKSEVPMMYMKSKFHCFFDEENNVQGIELPYKGGGTSMIIVMPTSEEPLGSGKAKIKSLCNIVLNEFKSRSLYSTEVAVLDIQNPKQIDALRGLEKSNLIQILETNYGDGVKKEDSPLQKFMSEINEGKIATWVKMLSSSHSPEVCLTLPKFKMESSLALTEIIRAMGITKVFVEGGLSRIGEDLSLSRALHKAFVEVDEKGTEAAAVTAMTIGWGISESVEFIVDRPFVFFIRHNGTNSILFMGKVISL